MSRTARRPAALVVALMLVMGTLLAAVGCGAPSADLFLVERTGEGPGANLKLLVSDDGSVRCNGKRPRTMSSALLLDARGIARDLDKQARRKVNLLPGRNAVLRYRVRLENGTVEFSDTSRPLAKDMLELAAFTRTISQRVCGLAR